MKKLLFVLTVLVLVSAGWAQSAIAQDHASHEDVLKLMDLMKCRELAKNMMDATISQMLPRMHQKMKQQQPDVSDAELADIDKILHDYGKQMPFDEMFDAMVPAYEKNLTKAEVQAMINFYSSPVGQSVLAKMPAISSDAMKEIQPILMKSMENMGPYMDAKIKELEKKYPHHNPAKPTS